MTSENASAHLTPTRIIWDLGTAYEFFVSLEVLHNPEKYGVRASWAAGIRSRIPANERKFLEETNVFFWVPLGWLYKLPSPKDAHSTLRALSQIPAERRMLEISGVESWKKPEGKILLEIAKNKHWTEAQCSELEKHFSKHNHSIQRTALENALNWWARPTEFGEALLSALQAYHHEFFEEEEKRLQPVLEAGLLRAQKLSQEMSPESLIAELSQGVHLANGIADKTLILAPAYWTTPLVLMADINETENMILFGVRPAEMSAIPGELVPDSLLRTLKTLADPTRLKILHYLAQETVTPSELSRRLHLRAPTVTHHLAELRLAGLVNLTIKGQEKLYTLRREALDASMEALKTFLYAPSTE